MPHPFTHWDCTACDYCQGDDYWARHDHPACPLCGATMEARELKHEAVWQEAIARAIDVSEADRRKHGGPRPGAGRPSAWRTPGETVTIRVPAALKDRVMEFARQLDGGA